MYRLPQKTGLISRLLRNTKAEILAENSFTPEAALDIASLLFGSQCIAAIGNCANINCLGCEEMNMRKLELLNTNQNQNEESKILGNVDCNQVYTGIRSFANCTGEGNLEAFCSVLNNC